MARLFVMSDNKYARVELIQDSESGWWSAFCCGCITGSGPRADDLLFGERFNLDGAVQVAGDHADRCTRCADPDCRTKGRHDAGHRCRKD